MLHYAREDCHVHCTHHYRYSDRRIQSNKKLTTIGIVVDVVYTKLFRRNLIFEKLLESGYMLTVINIPRNDSPTVHTGIFVIANSAYRKMFQWNAVEESTASTSVAVRIERAANFTKIIVFDWVTRIFRKKHRNCLVQGSNK
uniref:Uncharacterized protein n=1 Tax=Romanomermis culicivorax TaxID=13658 RepID=A0A915I477_ROMCU